MDGVVVLPTWMLHLDDWNEVLMDRLGNVSVSKNNTFYETFGNIINMDIHSCFIFQNCYHYLVTFFSKQLYRNGRKIIIVKRF